MSGAEEPSAKRLKCVGSPEKSLVRKRPREPEAAEKSSRAAVPADMKESSTPPCFAHRLSNWCERAHLNLWGGAR